MSTKLKETLLWFACDQQGRALNETCAPTQYECEARLARWFIPPAWTIDTFDLRSFARVMLANGYSIKTIELTPEQVKELRP